MIQAETGGGFGGKEEYPSMIALHAALLAGKAGRPVRMIYDRHEDIAATTKRHPAIVRHRTGVTHDGRLIAQDIEVVMDGGAYCTLTPVVLSRGAIHAGGPYRCPNVRIRARAARTNTPPNGAFRGFGAPQVEFAAETQLNRIAEMLDLSPLEIRRRNVYVVGDTTPTGQVLHDSVAGEEVLERAAEAGEFERLRARNDAARSQRAGAGIVPEAPTRTGTDRMASGIGLALAWHGAGFTGSGEVKLASVASIELTGEGEIRILTASTEMGQGTKTIFPQLVAEALGVPIEAVEIAPQDTAFVPDSGPTVASRTAMVVGGLLIKAAQRLRSEVETTTGGTFASTYRDFARAHGPLRIDQRFEPYPGVDFDDTTYRGDAYPAFGWAACVAQVDVDLDTGEVHVRDVVAADDIGHVIHPVLAEGQVEGGTLQAVGLRHDRGDQAARRAVPQRPAGDVHHPDRRSMPRGSRRSWSRRRSPVRRTAPRGSASCRWTSGRRPWSPRSPMRPASGSASCRPARSGSLRPSRAIAAVAPLPPGASEPAA